MQSTATSTPTTTPSLVTIPARGLREPAREALATPLDGSARARVLQMVALMRGHGGIGLAAPQVGWSAALYVLDLAAIAEAGVRHPAGAGLDAFPLDLGDDWCACASPAFAPSEEQAEMWEGCLSIPFTRTLVRRAAAGTVSFTDAEGRRWDDVPVSGLLAAVVQHEGDHLQGALITTRSTRRKRAAAS